MKPITLELHSKRYPIHFAQRKPDELALLLSKQFQSPKWVLVTHPHLDRLYGKKIARELKMLGEVKTILIPPGEKQKTLQTVGKLYQAFVRHRVDRKTPILALGGGVLGDLTGFAAATFLRGVPFVQIPTSLVAQVDSSVGGKTGVDLPVGKNLVGAFYQPHLVYIDPQFLKTLPPRELLCGFAEVIKYGAIQSASLFSTLEKSAEDFFKLEEKILEKVIRGCVTIKARIVQADEREVLGLRSLLNFGHTLGHAIETLSGYRRWNHGEAVAIGMVFASRLSSELGFLDDQSARRIADLIARVGLPTAIPRYPVKDFLKVMSLDKKMMAGKIRYVLLRKIGEAFNQEFDFNELGSFLSQALAIPHKKYGRKFRKEKV